MRNGSYRLQRRVGFDPPLNAGDGHGGIETGWDDAARHECRAGFLYLRGGEAVQAARLAGRQPVVVTIRTSAVARTITPAWRMVDLHDDTVFNIRTVVPTEDRRWLELTVESGVAV